MVRIMLMIDPQTKALLEHLLKAISHGYSATEIIWELKNGLVYPVELKHVPSQRLVFDGDTPKISTLESWSLG